MVRVVGDQAVDRCGNYRQLRIAEPEPQAASPGRRQCASTGSGVVAYLVGGTIDRGTRPRFGKFGIGGGAVFTGDVVKFLQP